ncbi:ABC transporter ATP-binding protein [Pseudomonas eucalypticola]|uniref:ABC transporter ATP-binding protein n=1 Tax=Pseudomonas eucalypticola TaxID=2599595 RepID=A0A7D5HE01_9PSED|nr:ABC transporter ATP-binding protein [Pseudomonas eucalypticola]QKZ05110.1 ABC transporter ATP-binding protein [Pseudomonas eucalypticola]WAH56115.1 ABC transporter ATP-binding protein [Pseudomonas silvicola]
MNPPLLQAEGLGYRLGARTLFENVSLSIAPGDCIALLGANGAGKSTLMKVLLGLLKPGSGQVQINGQPLQRLDRRSIARQLAYVPQSHVPSFPYTVGQIVTQGRLPITGLGRAPAAADLDAVGRALQAMGIEHLAARTYTELSGGERQLVLIARALVQEARLILLDEPVTGLDFGHQLRLLERLQQLAARGLAILTTSHRPEQALAGANRAWVLHEGRLIADGPPHQVIDAALMQRLYGVPVRQIDSDHHRFFVPL